MTTRRALVNVSGEIKELPSGDVLATAVPEIYTQTTATRNETATVGLIVILCDCTSNSITVNLPTAVGNTAVFFLKKTDSSANTVTVDGASTETIDGGATAVLQTQDEAIILISDNANWRIF